MTNTRPPKGKAKSSTRSSSPRTTITTTTITTTVLPPNIATPKTATKRRKAAASSTITSSTTTSSSTPTDAPPTAKKKRTSHTLELKAQFIKDVLEQRVLDPKASVSSVARWAKYRFSRQEASRLLQDKDDIFEAVKKLGPNAGCITKMYPRKLEVIEDVIFGVFEREIAAKLPVNDSRFKEVAFQTYVEVLPFLKAAMAPNSSSFAFSDGWLTNFKKSRGIRMQQGHGEEGDVDWEANRPKFAAIATLLLRYHPKDIYNCDETGLYLRVLSNRSLSHKRHVGRKISKEARVTVMLCCNAEGSHKIKPFVLSKNRPNGITKETEARLRCHFKHGYINSALFKDWLLELDAEMEKEGRHIALLLDNAPGHGKEEGEDAIVLKNIELIRHLSNGALWTCLASAWDEVTSTTIRNCFAHVPTLPDAMKDELRMPHTDGKDHEMDQLKQELIDLYPDRAKDIALQKDYGVLAYLKSCEGQGPNEYLMEAIRATASSEKYKCFFTAPEDLLESDEDDDDDEADLNYAETGGNDADVSTQRIYGLRSGEKEVDMVLGVPSSQESADVASEEAPERAIQDYEEFLNEAKAVLEHLKTHCKTHQQAVGALPVLPPLIKATSHMKRHVQLMRDHLALSELEDESWLHEYTQHSQQYPGTIALTDSENE